MIYNNNKISYIYFLKGADVTAPFPYFYESY